VIRLITFLIILSFIIYFPTDIISANIVQVDSLKQNDVALLDSIRHNLIIDQLINPEFGLSKFFIYDLPDSLMINLRKDWLNNAENRNYLFQSSFSEQWRINDELTKYIKFQKGLALKSDLGVFSQILGEARNLTAIILAILHVIKYKKGLYR